MSFAMREENSRARSGLAIMFDDATEVAWLKADAMRSICLRRSAISSVRRSGGSDGNWKLTRGSGRDSGFNSYLVSVLDSTVFDSNLAAAATGVFDCSGSAVQANTTSYSPR